MSVKNFVQCGLVTPVATNTTELVLVAPTAPYQYPDLAGGTLVIADSVARPSFYEIISYTHRIENVLYGVVRAKEGTTARAWTGTTWIYQALTAQDYVDALALKAALDSPALTGTPTAPTAPLGSVTNQIATMAAIKEAIDNLIGGAPGALDALNEFAAALGNDPNFATTMTNALAGKEPSIAAGTSDQMWLGNKTWASVLSQVQGTLLTGLGAGANTPIVNTDTLIGALANIQNQLNNKASFTDTRLSDARDWTATQVSQAEAEAGTATVDRKWTAQRVAQAARGVPLTGLNLTVNAAITATDSPLSALGKLQKQISDAATNLAGNVRATELTGFVTGSNASVVNTDSVLVAFGKVQAQMNAKQTSHANLTALSGLAGVADRLPYFTGAGALSLTTLTGLARNLLDDTTQSEMQSTLGLVKQTNVDDLTPGRMVLTGSVRHRVSAGVSSTHRDRLILLHPLYQSTLLPYSIVDGKFTATRGDRAASLNQTIAEVVSSSAYDAHATSLYDLGGNPADPWQAVSCTYQGVKYAALIVPYHVSGYGNGIFFEGRAVSDDANLLLCIEYYNRETSTVLNSEVYDSIAPLPVRKTLRVGGETVYHTGNILGTVSQSGGVPTGAIIERGSNANGEYVRYADGTQICWGRLTFAGSWRVTTNFVSSTAGDMYFANVSVTHPAVFATAPVSVPAVATGPAWGVRGLSSKTTTSSFQVYSGSAATVEIAFLTVGRWL